MDLQTEQRLLRIALTRGLLRWDDLESVADRLPSPSPTSDPAMCAAGWFQALLYSGRIDIDSFAQLASELPDGPDTLALGPKRRLVPVPVLRPWGGGGTALRF